MSKFFTILATFLLIPLFVYGAVFGSKSMLHVQTASTLDPGRLDFRSNLNFYTKLGDFLGQQKPANFSAVNYWLVQSNALLTYGVVPHLDITLMARIYQDTHYSNEYNSPDDIFLDVKAGSFALSDRRFNFGGIFSFRFPTGEVHNYPFEPYTAGSLEYGITGLFSFYNDPFLPDRDFSLHVNLGWYYHNDAGKTLYEFKNPQGQVLKKFTAGTNASELQFGLGLIYPTELFNLNLELWGINFIQQPDTMAYSRENYMYITPSIKFKPRPWLSFDFGMDIRVTTDKNETATTLPDLVRNLTLPNYPAWRINLGLNVALLRGGKVGRGYSSEEPIEKKIDFFQNLLKEQERSKKIEEELRRLRKERERAEKELEELKQLLEEKK